MLHCLVMLVQFGLDSTNVKVRTSNCDIFCVHGELYFQCSAEVTQGSMKLAHLFIVAAKIVASYCKEAATLPLTLICDEDCFGILKLLKCRLVIALPQTVHAIFVACQD
jgi:hypothetical protein